MVVVNKNNWHWVDKNCEKYAQEYFAENFTNITLENETHEFNITSSQVSGDCDVTQRKGSVRCLFDLILTFAIQARNKGEDSNSESNDIKGDLIIKEFIHDETDFEYEFKNFGSNKSLIQKDLLPLLLPKLAKFQPDLINDHTADVQE
ncbi:hypothetical protein WICMUC_001266 [Wickerhamomyces mucosus]|uniref:Activator of Hsp90 ATPase AHSA1-like N-terminal domain-containing protein n=1 Tax=Wickerhamomyces mucosus TaxID=1378264 RepID=A0A9P8TI01_9ASCO|nr:hypothetical protein WICMUC_001266 [Wickerhamomyces mucosus]